MKKTNKQLFEDVEHTVSQLLQEIENDLPNIVRYLHEIAERESCASKLLHSSMKTLSYGFANCGIEAHESIPLEYLKRESSRNVFMKSINLKLTHDCMRHGDVHITIKAEDKDILFIPLISYDDCLHMEGIGDLRVIEATMRARLKMIEWETFDKKVKEVVDSWKKDE